MVYIQSHSLRASQMLWTLYLLGGIWGHYVNGGCLDGKKEVKLKTLFYCSVELNAFDDIYERPASFCDFLVIKRVKLLKGKLEYKVATNFGDRMKAYRTRNNLNIYVVLSVLDYKGFSSTDAFKALKPVLKAYDGFIWDGQAKKQDNVEKVAKMIKDYCDANGKKVYLYDSEGAYWSTEPRCTAFSEYFNGVVLYDLFGTQRLTKQPKDVIKRMQTQEKEILKRWKECKVEPINMIQEIIYDHTESGHLLSSRTGVMPKVKKGSGPHPQNGFNMEDYKDIINREEFVKIGKDAKKNKVRSFLVPFHLATALAPADTSGPILDVAVNGLKLGNSD